MLDSNTKKKIDDLRNILVGKIPSPQSQVEQITTGLIYKFMYDMDNEAITMGGVPSFFIDEYEKYSWKNLFNTKLGGVEKVKLYSDAIENLYNNPNAPRIFREIFKNSFLPFKDPSTLNMFLKEINEFHYSNSEKLGDAYEYLLSFMGSQGDAGQFRTPRHIIDFIVQIVNPKKKETILDPACGTAGFLISSYKHILNQNTQTRIGDKLNALERKQIGENLVGYDIDPSMSRISLVNMYLHNFASPNISEYDTLSSEEKWNEYFDVILANPPFFSPTGGIKPHSRFGVKSTRAEVLFVDYIIEHLKPEGRAGIIVPEGIIFQTKTAYKFLRKKLVESCLVGVISLPAGVFQPYSGVKTSILILDKELHKKSESIFFAKVENDGFSLGAQRQPIPQNDLIEIKRLISENSKFSHQTADELFEIIQKSDIRKKDFNLSASSYKSSPSFNSGYPKQLLTKVASLKRGTTITKKDVREGSIPVIAGGQKPPYFHNQSNRDTGMITVSSSGAYAGFISFHDYPIFASDCFTVVSKDSNLNQKFLFHLLKSKQQTIYQMQTGGGQPHIYARDFDNFEIPLPPIEVQQQIVDELEGYQKIIDGCRQVVDYYKPTFEIDPSWEMIELGELAILKYGLGESAVDEGSHRFIRISDINEFGLLRSDNKKYASIDNSKEEYILKKNDILIARTGATYGKCLYFEDSEPSIFAGYLIKVSLNEKVIPKFFWIFSQSNYFDVQKRQLVVGAGQPQFNANTLKKLLVPVPPIEQQHKIIQEVMNQQELIKGNINLMNNFQHKMDQNIDKIWG